MAKIKVAVFGATGRMGLEVLDLAQKAKDLKLVSLDKGPDVIIDFSSPAGTLEISKWCAKNKVPLVSGTTGLSSVEEKKLKQITKPIAFLMSPNFSLGLNAMARAVQVYMDSTSPKEIAIEETHHINKKDNPSGTAKFLHRVILKEASKKTKVLEPVGFRVGDVFGVHKVNFFLDGEVVSFIHEAQDRTIFAKGAIEVAKWIVDKRPGFYVMADYIKGLKK